ncbi:diguanylate cyclase (GGDEF)-like protein [Actinoplanes tereljensis]|uniref:GGDEF domain-containing protein n=1 Tax=Paractinoplanes tereljensis TaxID=571912 RepID=UPI001940EBEF|nr:GGDEF domain-containing protein [Actinoplanes tereljensis]
MPFVPGLIGYAAVMFLVTEWFYRVGLSPASPKVTTALLVLFLALSHERWQRLLGGGHLHNRLVLRLAVANAGAAAISTYAGWSFLAPGWAILIAAVHLGWSGARSRIEAGVITAVVTVAAQVAVHAHLAPSVIPLKYADGAAVWGLLLAVTALHNIAVSAARGEDAAERLRHAASHDGLTGLPNRTEMGRRLASALPAAGPENLVALLYIDLDGFKGVNDTHGHATGDALLVAAAERFREGLRPGDELCRLGGDEFAVILTGMPSTRSVDDVVAGLAEAIRRPFTLSGRTVRVGASIGSATADTPAADATMLVERADLAMYAVKHGPAATVR